MEAYIAIKEDHEPLMKEYYAIKDTAEKTHLAKYPLTKKWFLGKFPSFDMETAKKEISDNAINQTAGIQQ